MELTQIGTCSKPHGIRGELKLRVDDWYLEDLENAKALLIGSPPIPYFIESLRIGGSTIVKLEGFDTRESVALFSGKPVHLPSDQVTAEVEADETPFDALIGWTIVAEGYPELGPIESIMDLPQHYLATIQVGEKEVFIPLHEDLVTGVNEAARQLTMELPGGLLDL